MDITAEILSTYQKDEGKAFQMLFDAYHDDLFLFAHRILQDPEAAEDVVQECYVECWTANRLERFSGSLDKYMFGAVRHASLNYLRSKQRRNKWHEAAEKEDTVLPVISTEEEVESYETLYTAINKLPEERRKIFLMFCIDGKKYQEIADTLHISKNTVKTQMKRALKTLRESLQGKELSSILFFLLKKSFFVSPQN